MRYVLIAAALLVGFASPTFGDLATVPVEFREENWFGSRNEGCCTYAAQITALRCAGQYPLADWYRKTQGNAGWASKSMRLATKCKLPFSATTTASREWMEWALRNRLVVCACYYEGHFVNVVGRVEGYIIIVDNNLTKQYRFVKEREFYAKWGPEFSGFAMAFLYTPLPPWPKSAVDKQTHGVVNLSVHSIPPQERQR